MATHAPAFGRASALPLSAVLASIPSYPRPVIERLVARLIDHLDEEDGDADLEPNGDELDGTDAEDEVLHNFGLTGLHGPGCPISDPGEDDA